MKLLKYLQDKSNEKLYHNNKLYHNKFEDYELVKKKTVEEATPTHEGEEVEETVEDMVEDDAILV